MPAFRPVGLDGLCQPGPTPGKQQSLGSFCDPIEPTADVTYQRMTDYEHSGGMEGLEPAHRSEALFQEPVSRSMTLVR